MSFSSNFGRAIDLANAAIKSKTKFAGLETDIGSLSALATTNKSSLVAAVNELKSMVAALAPVITSGQSISGNTAASVNYTVTGSNITVSGNIKRVSWSASSLPSGLSIDASTGVITGTVTTAGTYNFAVSVTTNIGTATENIAMEVTMPAYLPEITSGQSISGKMTQAITSYQVTGTNVATDSSKGITSVQWTASGLPSGLSINSSTGVISGTVLSSGSWTATVTCTTNYGSASASISVSIAMYYPPSLGNLSNTTAQMNTLMVCASNDTNAHVDSSKGITSEQWSASGLPPGVSVNSIGQIVGTPTTAGTYNGTYTVTTNYGTATASVYIVVAKYYPPNLNDSSFTYFNGAQLGMSTTNLRLFQNIEVASGNEYFKGMTPYMKATNTRVDSSKGITSVKWSASGLPSGMYIGTRTSDGAETVNITTTYYYNGDGYLYGTPSVTGTFTVYITCTNNYGSSTYTQQITVKSCSYPPSYSSQTYNWASGTYANYYLGKAASNLVYDSTKDNPAVRIYLYSGTLPPGTAIGINSISHTATIYGTPTTKGTYSFTVRIYTTQGYTNAANKITIT